MLENAEPGWFALKDNPALSGTEITSPKQEIDEFGAAQRHLQIHRQRPPGLPGSHPPDRPARRRLGDRAEQRRNRRSDLGPLRGRARQRSQDAADHQLRAEPGRDRRPHRRPDLRRLHQHRRRPGPGQLPAARRPADQPQPDQPVAGLGDAGLGSAARRHQGGPDRPHPHRPLPADLLPLPRPGRGHGPRRLRGDLLRPDQTDPDHPDPAGDRGPGADDRRHRRLQHRHLRANKGGGAGGTLDVERDLGRLQARHRDDHRRQRRHPAHRLRPLRARHGRGQGLRLRPRRRHDRLAADRGRLHPGAARLDEPLAPAALAQRPGRRPERGSAGTSTSWARAAGSSRSRA